MPTFVFLKHVRNKESIRIPPTYLDGNGALVSGLKIRITRVTIWASGVLTYLLSPSDPPSTAIDQKSTTIGRSFVACAILVQVGPLPITLTFVESTLRLLGLFGVM